MQTASALAALLLFTAAATAASAQSTQPIPSDTGTTADAARTAPAPKVLADEDRIVCRSERFTGSRFPVRTCRTRKQWAERLDENRRHQERVTERSRPERYRPPITIN